MDPTKLIEVILDKGVLGALLIGSLWANLKLYQQVRAEHAERLKDSKDATLALLTQNDKVHSALTSVANVLETIGTTRQK
jgi:hypothetical protein